MTHISRSSWVESRQFDRYTNPLEIPRIKALMLQLTMKFSVLIYTVAIIALATLESPALAQNTTLKTTDFYKTPKAQVVLTGLQPKRKYEFQYKNAKGRIGQRQVKANACGEAVIGKAATFQSLSIEGQEVLPTTLPTKQHDRCQPPKKSVTRLVQPSINPARRN